jgi:thioredoxin 2
VNTVQSDARGALLTCPHCAQRNRLKYEALNQPFRCGKCHNEIPPLAEPVDITSDLAFDALISHSPLSVLVDFWAPWCGPCKMVAPEFAKVARETAGRFVVAKVNTEDLQGLSARFRITAIPTMAIFKKGLEVARQTGAMPAARIHEFISQNSLA